MQKIERDGYSKEEIVNMLHGKYGARHLRFRYDLLDKNDKYIRTLNNVISGEVSMSALSQIKRTAKFTLKDDGNINYLSDRIQPFVEVKMRDGKYIAYSLGIFLLASPKRKDQDQMIVREIEAYDASLILRDDKFDSRYTIQQGTNYRDAVIGILTSAGITKHNIEQTDKTLSTTVDFEPGTGKLEVVNNLLSAINYTPAHVDVYGYFTSSTYKSPSLKTAEYTYVDDSLSVTYEGMSEELDTFSIANKWVAVLSNPEREPLISTYTNTSEDSPTSTVNRGRTIVDYRTVDDMADQAALDGYTQRIAFESSQVFGKLEFETAIMPFHDYADVLNVQYSPLGIDGKYSETEWTIPLEIGGRMSHSVRKVVNV